MTFRDLRRARAASRAVSHRRPWCVALGRGDDTGLRLGGVWRPWHSATEAALWHQWARGGGDRRAIAQTTAHLTQDTATLVWWCDLSHAFDWALRSSAPPRDWTDPEALPNLARLRWVPVWPWDAARAHWATAGTRWPAIPGFEPWAAVTRPDQPLTLTQWFEAGAVSDTPSSLRVPWLYAVLGQTAMLQALGAGYWDLGEGDGHAVAFNTP